MLNNIFKTLIMMSLLAQSTLAAQTFAFKYSYEGEKLSINQEATDYNSALTIAAKNCFSHFKSKTKSNHQKGVELIDVCANPRS